VKARQLPGVQIERRGRGIGVDEKESHSAFMSALTTEHFALQTAANATVSEAAARSSLYVFALSSSLVAMGFASRSREIFVPFIAIVLPGLFLLGVVTVVRLVDTALSNMRFLAAIARIRSHYRTIMPEAAKFFAVHHRRPDSFRLGRLVAFLTTSASMIAFVNSIVAGVGVALLAGDRLGGKTTLALVFGGAAAVVLMAAFLAYQRWRFRVFELEEAREEG
jgi:hypothetical protein